MAARSCSYSLAGSASSNPAGGIDVCYECCVLLGRSLCDRPIIRPEKSYRLCVHVFVRVCVCEREVHVNRRLCAHWGLLRHRGNKDLRRKPDSQKSAFA
jgi:hypothetical protein